MAGHDLPYEGYESAKTGTCICDFPAFDRNYGAFVSCKPFVSPSSLEKKSFYCTVVILYLQGLLFYADKLRLRLFAYLPKGANLETLRMPPQITFIDLGGVCAVPVKLIVRKRVGKISKADPSKESLCSVNSLSLVRLQTPQLSYQVRLSNNYLNTVINEYCKRQLKAILFTSDVPLNKSQVFVKVDLEGNEGVVNSNRNSTQSSPVCILMAVPISLILAVRQSRGANLLEDEQQFLDRALKINPLDSHHVRLLVRRLMTGHTDAQVQIAVEEKDDEDLGDIFASGRNAEVKKDLVRFKLSNRHILHSMANCIKIYVSD